LLVDEYRNVEESKVDMCGADGVSIRWLIGKNTKDAPFYMRHFTVEVGGNTPLHTHNFEHEVYILEGEGEMNTGEKTFPLKPGSFLFVKKNEKHQFRNLSKDIPLKFLCMIPVN